MSNVGLSPDYLEMMRAHVDDGGKLSHRNGLDLLTEIERLTASPITKWNGTDKLGNAELARRLEWVIVQVTGLPDGLPQASMNVLHQTVAAIKSCAVGSPVLTHEKGPGL